MTQSQSIYYLAINLEYWCVQFFFLFFLKALKDIETIFSYE